MSSIPYRYPSLHLPYPSLILYILYLSCPFFVGLIMIILIVFPVFFEVHSFFLSSLGQRHYWILGLVSRYYLKDDII